MSKKTFTFHVKIIKCPFCEHITHLNEEITMGQPVYCSDCDTQFEIVGEIEGVAISNIIPNNMVRFKAGNSCEDFDKETIQEMVEHGIIRINDQEGLVLTEAGIEAAKKIKELKRGKVCEK